MPKKASQSARPSAILAAGGVLWRCEEKSGTPEVAVVHRNRYDDWSLPKGKIDPGETAPVTAVREIEEETGYAAELGRFLMTASYPLDVGTKKVTYWAARALGGEFAPNDEVDQLIWLPISDAIKRVGYPCLLYTSPSPRDRS